MSLIEYSNFRGPPFQCAQRRASTSKIKMKPIEVYCCQNLKFSQSLKFSQRLEFSQNLKYKSIFIQITLKFSKFKNSRLKFKIKNIKTNKSMLVINKTIKVIKPCVRLEILDAGNSVFWSIVALHSGRKWPFWGHL